MSRPLIFVVVFTLLLSGSLTSSFAQAPTPPGCNQSCNSVSLCPTPLACNLGQTNTCRNSSCPDSPDCICPPWYNPSQEGFRSAVIGDPGNPGQQRTLNATRYAFAQLTWVIHSIAVILNQNMHPDSLDAIRSLFAYLPLHPPASGIAEVSRVLSRFDLASPASAQGYGFGASWALRPVWAAMRNSAFLTMVLFLVAAGFMIIFRVKTGPRTALSVTSLIPRAVITLLAITFSFALAGFIIDLVYLTVASVVVILNPIGIVTYIPAALNFFATPGFFEKLIAYYLLPYVILITGILTIGGPAAILAILATIPGIVGVITIIILILTTLILLARVWWVLVKTYISLIFLLILAPWIILIGFFPSGPSRKPSMFGLSGWLRAFIAHAAVFAVVPLLFLTQIAFWRFPVDLPLLQDVSNFLGSVFSQLFTGVTQVPTTGSFPAFPLFSAQGGIFDLVISWVILALIPKTANMIKDALQVSGAGKYETAFGEALGPVGALATPLVGGYAAPRMAGRLAGMFPESSLTSQVIRGSYQFLENRFRFRPIQQEQGS